jgi:hypothetical protein
MFIYFSWVSTQWQWSVNLYRNSKGTGIYKGETIQKKIQKKYKITKYKTKIQNKNKHKKNITQRNTQLKF